MVTHTRGSRCVRLYVMTFHVNISLYSCMIHLHVQFREHVTRRQDNVPRRSDAIWKPKTEVNNIWITSLTSGTIGTRLTDKRRHGVIKTHGNTCSHKILQWFRKKHQRKLIKWFNRHIVEVTSVEPWCLNGTKDLQNEMNHWKTEMAEDGNRNWRRQRWR